MSRYRHVDAMKAEGFPVAPACEAAEVSTSAYYAWKAVEAAGPSSAVLDEAYLVNEIIGLHGGSDSTYGSPRVTNELQRRGYCVNHKRIERLMAPRHRRRQPQAVRAHHLASQVGTRAAGPRGW